MAGRAGKRKRRSVPTDLQALLIPADPTQPVEVINLWENGKDNEVARIQEAVEGHFDVQAHPEGDIWINDEGRIIDMPVNVRASSWVLNDSTMAKDGRAGEWSVLYGPAVLTGPADRNGDATAVKPEMVELFQGMEVDPDRMRDWDVRNVDIVVMDWPDDRDIADDGGMEL